MEISVTGPRAVNELGGPVIPGDQSHQCITLMAATVCQQGRRVQCEPHLKKQWY